MHSKQLGLYAIQQEKKKNKPRGRKCQMFLCLNSKCFAGNVMLILSVLIRWSGDKICTLISQINATKIIGPGYSTEIAPIV